MPSYSHAPSQVPAYTSPFTHNQHGQAGYHQNAPPPAPAADGGMGSIPATQFGAWGIDGATAQLGMQLGHSAVAAGQEYMQRNVCIS